MQSVLQRSIITNYHCLRKDSFLVNDVERNKICLHHKISRIRARADKMIRYKSLRVSTKDDPFVSVIVNRKMDRTSFPCLRALVSLFVRERSRNSFRNSVESSTRKFTFKYCTYC